MKQVAKLKYDVSPLSESHLIVPVKINGTGPHNFILDTGSSVVCVCDRLAQDLQLEEGDSHEALGASGTFKINVVKIKSISVGKALRRNLDVAVMELSEISLKMGMTIDGILGYDFLRKYQLSINYLTKEIILKK